jgi:uncharacterized protein YjbI with pentapeptide repeats
MGLEILHDQGVDAWNQWRIENPTTRVNLSGANLSGANLSGADLREADLIEADLSWADLREANLIEADLSWADLGEANLREADLREADLREANLSGADLREANLSGADLKSVVAIKTDFSGANLTGCQVYGISAWDVNLEKTIQSNLVITEEEPHIQVDDLEVAQFIYLLLNRRKLRNVITTLGEKGVLILGRFSERKELLDGIAAKLRTFWIPADHL